MTQLRYDAPQWDIVAFSTCGSAKPKDDERTGQKVNRGMIDDGANHTIVVTEMARVTIKNPSLKIVVEPVKRFIYTLAPMETPEPDAHGYFSRFLSAIGFDDEYDKGVWSNVAIDQLHQSVAATKSQLIACASNKWFHLITRSILDGKIVYPNGGQYPHVFSEKGSCLVFEDLTEKPTAELALDEGIESAVTSACQDHLFEHNGRGPSCAIWTALRAALWIVEDLAKHFKVEITPAADLGLLGVASPSASASSSSSPSASSSSSSISSISSSSTPTVPEAGTGAATSGASAPGAWAEMDER